MLKHKKFIFPLAILVLIILTYFTDRAFLFPIKMTLMPFLIGGGYVTWNTVKAVIRLKKITAGTMVVLALIGTFYVGEFTAGAIVAFMMIFGELLEDLTLEQTRNAVHELVKLVPPHAVKKINGKFVQVSLKQVRVRDILLVKPGDRVPVDGRIVAGQACLNEAALTGESIPVDKTVGHRVYVGTLNENGAVEIETEKIGSGTTLGKIISVVKQAQNNKGRFQRVADRLAGYFTPAIIVICVLVWLLTFDIFRVMAILVVACPCALVLATPTAVVASVGNAARKGGLIKGGNSQEKAGKITALCFDKTGTITEGKPEVVNVSAFGAWTEEDVLRYAALAEKNSQHPTGKTIVDFALRQGLSFNRIEGGENFRMLFGRGVIIDYHGESVEVSNAGVLGEADLILPGKLEGERYLKEQEEMGRTALLVLKGNDVIGGISVADVIRASVPETIREIKAMGIKNLFLLTGDNETTAASLAEQSGIEEYQAGMAPDDKLRFIETLKARGQVVAMVGDGVNDAPALAVADVGIAMGAMGTDVAVETADIALMSDDIALLPEILDLSRVALKTIKENIWIFAVAVNLIGLILSGTGFLTPITAALIHNIASIMVVGNSARLLNYNYRKIKANR